MKYRLFRGVLNQSDVDFYTRAGMGFKATPDVLEVDYSENGQQGCVFDMWCMWEVHIQDRNSRLKG